MTPDATAAVMKRPILGEGIGAGLPRKEDDRLMRGRGQYVGDIRMPKIQDVAFVHSPLAHARIRAIHVPDACRRPVFTAANLTDLQPIRAVSNLADFDVWEQSAPSSPGSSKRRSPAPRLRIPWG